jgi:hypothetical protein
MSDVHGSKYVADGFFGGAASLSASIRIKAVYDVQFVR